MATSHDSETAPERRRAPAVLLQRLCGTLDQLLARRLARHADGDVIELLVDDEEAAQGGMVTVAMRVPVRCACDPRPPCPRCGGAGTVDELFSAWLAVPPDVAEGTVLTPSAWLPGMLNRVYVRVRRRDAWPDT